MSCCTTFRTLLGSLAPIALALGLLQIQDAHAQLTFGVPTAVPSLNTPNYAELARGISADGLTIYLSSLRPVPPSATSTESNLWVSTRATTTGLWDPPTPIAELNSSNHEFHPHVTPDELTIVYDGPNNNLWISNRVAKSDPWSAPHELAEPINSAQTDGGGFLTADGLTFLFQSDRPGGLGQDDLYQATRTAVDAPWTVSNLGDVINTAANERGAYLSSDGLYLFFSSTRPGGQGDYDLYLASRESTTDSWRTPVNLGPEINTPQNENFPLYWDAGQTLFFRSHGLATPQGQADIFQVQLVPEPSSSMLLVLGCLLIGYVSRQQRRAI